MTTISVVPALLGTLVSSLAAALPTRAVFDGPGVTDESVPDYLLIGVADPDADSPDDAVETNIEWAGLGQTSRYEYITVRCVAVSWSGDTDVKAVRDRAYASFAAVEQTLTADPSLGDIARFGGLAASHALRQNIDADGAVAWVLFALQFTARLSG
jgi:hypothetical protein